MIDTYSLFYYGHTVTEDNQNFPLDEGSGEINAILSVGGYSLSDFVNELQRALNEASGIGNNYVCSVNRDTRRITISADSNFDILSSSSTLVDVSVFELAGFDTGSDKTGSNSYIGENGSGSVYEPQFKLQSYSPFENRQESSSAVVNQSASGRVEVVKYGLNKFMSANITLANDYDNSKAGFIKDNPSGVSDLRDFLAYCITKNPIEFIEDESNTSSFQECILESTRADRKGTGFELRELLNRKLAGYYESGDLTFRLIES